VQITVNGNGREIPTGVTVAELIGQLDLPTPHFAVEVNGEVVPRRKQAECHLAEGDRVEVVTLVGGG
jgi:thiamine biosynthesis protein ThiS